MTEHSITITKDFIVLYFLQFVIIITVLLYSISGIIVVITVLVEFLPNQKLKKWLKHES